MSVVLDSFFRPCVVGNGRVLITGRVKATQGDAHEVRWIVQEKNPIWPKTAFDPTVGQVTGKTDGSLVWFYATGFDPSPHEQYGRDHRMDSNVRRVRHHARRRPRLRLA